ncbi:transcriptional activator FtrB [Clostridium sp. N3C]|uniref:Crp/Fnr family transcriptional regulator n=1 Tax=Clostridium sp. N3C TaxID=1776758 RepID=UPI00092E189B|nr:Crp/Fnr family transcriptional regulator [Clostridium sp. N3C]SCN23017.1 transcriptional activator FtrB [Clostridium sp. N3C]
MVEHHLFRDFNRDELVDFFSSTDYSIKPYGKEDIIFVEDETCTNLSIVLEGEVEIQKIDSNGKVLTVAHFKKGDTFGENLIFGDKNTYPMTVISKTKSTVLHIPKDSVALLCQKSSSFLYQYLRTLSNRAVNLSSKLKQVTLKTIRQQICEFLHNKYISSGESTIKLGMSKKEWADKLGVQRPSLSRELIKMKEEGIIDYDKDTISILDFSALKKM